MTAIRKRWRDFTANTHVARLCAYLSYPVAHIGNRLQKRPGCVAVCASLTLHALFVYLLLLSPRASLSGGGHSGVGTGGDGSSEVSLVTALPEVNATTAVKPQPEEDLQALQPVPELATTDTSELATPLEAQVPQLPQKIAMAGASGMSANNQAGDAGTALWNAIAPCWKRMADASTQAVTLDVSFNATGGLSAPPVIERDSGAPPDSITERSEATALAALSQCGNYAMVSKQQNLKVSFPKP